MSEPQVETKTDTPVVEKMVDEGEKLLNMKPKEARKLGYEDPTAMHGPVDPVTGKPKYVFRLLHDMHREKRGGLGSWQCLTKDKMKEEGIELPNNPVPQHLQKANDSRVFFMDMYWGYRPYEVNEAERRIISEKSTRNVKKSENMDLLAENIVSALGKKDGLKVVDAFVKLAKDQRY